MRLLLDEMFPTETARQLREEFDHDAMHVDDLGLRGTDDPEVAAVARAERRVVVTENVVDYAGERDLVLVFVLKRRLPAGGAQANALARLLHRWATANPRPYVGPHWPS